MRITCISASNVKITGHGSISKKVCELIAEHIQSHYGAAADVQILSLTDYEVQPCWACGECKDSGRCIRDEAFNEIYGRLQTADGIFVVSPHYAMVPAKMVIISEKLEQIPFMQYLKTQPTSYGEVCPLFKKPVGLIAHGGNSTGYEEMYQKSVLDPLAHVFLTCGAEVVSMDDTRPTGVVFGVQKIKRGDNSAMIDQEHNLEEISTKVLPLVERLLEKITERM